MSLQPTFQDVWMSGHVTITLMRLLMMAHVHMRMIIMTAMETVPRGLIAQVSVAVSIHHAGAMTRRS